jgi:arginine/lysine/ornithine decarboxylase
LIKHPEVSLDVITSPTYEGVVSDIKDIAETVHRHKALLLVDEAHGAHFGFHDKFPKSSAVLGADLIIQSLHKTLPAFTQTALLHSNRPELNQKISEYLAIYQTSSPSYLLLSGIDRCVSLLEGGANELFDSYFKKLEDFRGRMGQLKKLSLLDRGIAGRDGVYDLDPSKLTIFTGSTAFNGHQLGRLLRDQFKIVMEMEARDYVLGMTSICDTKEGFDRLSDALLSLDKEGAFRLEGLKPAVSDFIRAERKLLPCQAAELKQELVGLDQSCMRVSAGFLSLFPPGSPLLVPGEIIRGEMISYLKQALSEGLTVTGLCGENKDFIPVLPD